nr:type II toxin-antitoxin system HicB family antitoxin [uncultured Lichenicoccus sp.]
MQIAGINDGAGFHADTFVDLEAAYHEAVDDYIKTCAKIGKAPEKAYNGQVMIRVQPRAHQNATLSAQMRGISLNQCAEEALKKQAEFELA